MEWKLIGLLILRICSWLSGDGEITPLAERMRASGWIELLSLLQAVEAMEVLDDEESLLQRALSANSWRHRVVRLLDESPKPLLRTLTRTLKEVMLSLVLILQSFLSDSASDLSLEMRPV